jgi:hypothetical protein
MPPEDLSERLRISGDVLGDQIDVGRALGVVRHVASPWPPDKTPA